MRFRQTNENDVQFEADLSGLTSGDVVTTIDEPYRPAQDAYGVGKYGIDASPGVCVWKLETTGNLVFVGSASDTGAIHWGANTDDDALGLSLTTQYVAIYSPTFGVMAIFNEGGHVITIPATTYLEVQDTSFGARLHIDDNGDYQIWLPSGASFTLFDSSLNPMLQMTEGSPDLHIPTGGNVVADL